MLQAFRRESVEKVGKWLKNKQTDKQANEHNRYTQAALFVYRRPRHDINSSRAGFASCLSAFLTRPLWNPVINHCIRPLISGHKNVAAGIESWRYFAEATDWPYKGFLFVFVIWILDFFKKNFSCPLSFFIGNNFQPWFFIIVLHEAN